MEFLVTLDCLRNDGSDKNIGGLRVPVTCAAAHYETGSKHRLKASRPMGLFLCLFVATVDETTVRPTLWAAMASRIGTHSLRCRPHTTTQPPDSIGKKEHAEIILISDRLPQVLEIDETASEDVYGTIGCALCLLKGANT